MKTTQTVLFSLLNGCAPVGDKSMMLSRVCTSVASRQDQIPLPFGPRCRRALVIHTARRSGSGIAPSHPPIPHIQDLVNDSKSIFFPLILTERRHKFIQREALGSRAEPKVNHSLTKVCIPTFEDYSFVQRIAS